MDNIINLTPDESYKKKKINLAKGGLFLAWIASVTAVTQGIINGISTGIIMTNLESTAIITIIVAITLLAINDVIAGVWTMIWNFITGRSLREHKRTAGFKVSWMMLLAALVAGPFATGCWMASVSFCGITYTVAVMSLVPITTAIVSRIVFKESLNARIYTGIVIAIIGVLIASYAPPEGASNFYLGIALAACAPIGFTLEGILSTYAADMIDPTIGCGLYRCFGSGILGFVAITLVASISGDAGIVLEVVKMTFTNPTVLLWVCVMALMAAISYGGTYITFNKSGPTRTLAVVNTMPVWSIPIGLLFTLTGVYTYSVTTMAIVGALIVVVGITLVVAKPSELFNLRDV